eukprot:TRINITY_DN291_c0_g1_i1.p1 TRINITY_DN291_c0_g1~~TRINITY_DN291_c0_g1_i1.p1  ORF type:complete len:180 (+),score=20.97 TRINITY_DN291_c0_g1_i1:22-561(+)
MWSRASRCSSRLTALCVRRCKKICVKPRGVASATPTSKNLRMIIFGPPGSGKGTQTEKIERDYGLISASTGNVLRQAIADGTPLGLQVKEILARGDLVSDPIMLRLVQDLVQKKFKGHDWILDGFPRTMIQAAGLDSILAQEGQPLNLALMLDVPDDIIVDRISSTPPLSCLFPLQFLR